MFCVRFLRYFTHGLNLSIYIKSLLNAGHLSLEKSYQCVSCLKDSLLVSVQRILSFDFLSQLINYGLFTPNLYDAALSKNSCVCRKRVLKSLANSPSHCTINLNIVKDLQGFDMKTNRLRTEGTFRPHSLDMKRRMIAKQNAIGQMLMQNNANGEKCAPFALWCFGAANRCSVTFFLI